MTYRMILGLLFFLLSLFAFLFFDFLFFIWHPYGLRQYITPGYCKIVPTKLTLEKEYYAYTSPLRNA